MVTPERNASGRFEGDRVNLEDAPRLCATLAAWVLKNPRQSPSLIAWRLDGRRVMGYPEIAEIEVLTPRPEGPAPYWSRKAEPGTSWLTMTRVSSWLKSPERRVLALVRRPTPQGGRAPFLCCADCGSLRRHLYGWSNWYGQIAPGSWACHRCQGLSYSSEGGALVLRSRFMRVDAMGFGDRSPRPGPWDPYTEGWAIKVICESTHLSLAKVLKALNRDSLAASKAEPPPRPQPPRPPVKTGKPEQWDLPPLKAWEPT